MLRIDDQIVSYVYSKYIELLQTDKNATIDMILKEEPIASQISGQRIIGPQGTII